MDRIAAIIFISIILVSMNVPTSTGMAAETVIANKFDIKISLKPRKQYEGIVIGELNFVDIKITNLTDKQYKIGNYFRVLMKQDINDWSQFAMAASGPTQLSAKRISNLKYGYGSNSIAQMGEDKKSIAIHIGNSSSVVNDKTQESKNMDLEKWWPATIDPKSTVTVTWPTFWFTNSGNRPQFLATPSLSADKEKYFYWISFRGNEIMEVAGNTENLLKIINDTAAPVGLRAASAVWLLEDDIKNEKNLLPFITNRQAPESLAYRSMQALMIWGSPEIIEDVLALWRKREILPVLDEDMKFYFTWSSHENAAEATKVVKAGQR